MVKVHDLMTPNSPSDDYSDAALSVYRILEPAQLANTWCGEPYAVQITRTDGRLAWLAATEDEASTHGRRFGWDWVAAIVPARGKAH